MVRPKVAKKPSPTIPPMSIESAPSGEVFPWRSAEAGAFPTLATATDRSVIIIVGTSPDTGVALFRRRVNTIVAAVIPR
jgi:hypothetical protein